MARLPIVQGDVPVLRRKAVKVGKIDDHVRNLAADLHDTLSEVAGVGLAAPQVGVSERVVAIRVPENYLGDDQPAIVLTLINPEIVQESGEQYGPEGCLSLPNIVADVPRSNKITVRTLDLDGNRQRIHAEGEFARIFLHEIDHLDGVLFTDRVIDKNSIRKL
ncbi:peptide deformylase [soil metagenome]